MTDKIRLDLHVHSLHSPDSRLTLDEIAGQISYTGLKGFALTDHNTVAGLRTLPALRERYPGVLIVPGVEVSTRDGHLLAYGISEVPPTRRTAAETLEWVGRHNGVGVLAHPFRWGHGVGRRLAEKLPVPAIETVNGHSSFVANAKAELIAARRHLGHTGGSDVHELSDIGRAYTEFPGDLQRVDELLDVLRRGRTEASGHSLRWPGRLRWGLRTSVLRVARGLRPI